MEPDPQTTTPPELPASALRRLCDPAALGFQTTDELPDLQDVIGQPRALRALELGSEVGGLGYNIFILGHPGSGRTTLTQEYLQRKAASTPIPDDLCYVYNFDNPRAPRALRLPAGRGAELRKEMQNLVAFCQREIPKAFESQEYIQDRDTIVTEVKRTQDEAFAQLQEQVGKSQFVLVRTSSGVILSPAVNGEPMKPEDVEKLTDEERKKIEDAVVPLSGEVEKTLARLRDLGRATDEQLEALNQKLILYLVEPVIQRLLEQFAPAPENGPHPVTDYLMAVQADLGANAMQFMPVPAGEQIPAVYAAAAAAAEVPWTRRYAVNVLIDNSGETGAPVILESQPTYQNLLGRMEHEVVMGAARTDFTMIHPGALHKANGGFLILPARDMLNQPYAWDVLKRVLRDGVIRITELSSQVGMISTQTLEPEPIPLDVKVLLIGTPLLYHLLRENDEDFSKLFKVQAEFGRVMARTTETEHEYGLFIKSVINENRLPTFDSGAAARIIEQSSRLAENQHKLTTQFGKIADLVRESAYWARKEGQTVVGAAAVQRAIDEEEYRNNLVEERTQERMLNGILLIDTQGAVTGQINALTVMTLGDYAFGRPCRVTATINPGPGGIMDIERQATMGGRIHTKGVLILSGYLNERYSISHRLTLSASLTFEQSYDDIDGDSASAAELMALLSAAADVGLRQDRAITGSINQRGQIQAIGAVNEKIEGFFAVCNARGLTGEQGVIIPAANQRHLMLKHEVVAAVEAGQFHIWPVTYVDECVPVLTGMIAGEQAKDGTFPEGTFHERLAARLEKLHRLGRDEEEEHDHHLDDAENEIRSAEGTEE